MTDTAYAIVVEVDVVPERFGAPTVLNTRMNTSTMIMSSQFRCRTGITGMAIQINHCRRMANTSPSIRPGRSVSISFRIRSTTVASAAATTKAKAA